VISPQRRRRLRRPAFLGTLRRTRPLSDRWGFDRGTPVDRYYIERFLAENQEAVRGRVLEVKDSRYTERFGSDVRERAVLDIDSSNPHATVIADLAAADSVPADSFDCFILTQTLQYVYDLSAALRHAHRILSPGGVLLATAPALSRIDPGCADREYWRFTAASFRALLAEAFPPDRIAVRTYGNVLTGIAFLAGMAAEELRPRELAHQDPHFPLLVAARAEKGR
jgi:SAM-dependent methyltransferase